MQILLGTERACPAASFKRAVVYTLGQKPYRLILYPPSKELLRSLVQNYSIAPTNKGKT